MSPQQTANLQKVASYIIQEAIIREAYILFAEGGNGKTSRRNSSPW